MSDPFKPFYKVVAANLEASTDKEVRHHFLAAKQWFGWEGLVPQSRDRQIEDILGADPIAVEGGALDFYVHRKLMPKGKLKEWRNGDG